MDTVPELHAKAPQATVSEGLAQGNYVAVSVANTNPRPFGRKASNLPMRDHAPQARYIPHVCPHVEPILVPSNPIDMLARER